MMRMVTIFERHRYSWRQPKIEPEPYTSIDVHLEEGQRVIIMLWT